MAEHGRRAVCAMLLLCAATAVHAESTLQGLEMDVMEPGESAAQATARIALPRPRGGIERSAEYPGLDTDSRIGVSAEGRLGTAGGEALVVDAPSFEPEPGTGEPLPETPIDPVEPPADPDGGYTAPVDGTGGPGG